MPGYLSCPLCLKNTLSDVQDLQNKVASSLSRSLHCPICSAALQGLSSLHFHLAAHIPIPNALKALSLPASPEQIPSLEKLDIRDDPNSPKRTIEHTSTSESSNTDEANSSLKNIPFNCEFCGLIFSSEYFLTLHKDIMHSDINEFEVECRQCKSRFRDLEAYRDHVKKMHSDRRYICDHCPKSFKIKGGLLVHTRMFHDQSSPSTCQVCKKNFTSKARKELHEKRYHGAQLKKGKNSSEKSNHLNEAKDSLENLISEANQSSVEGQPQTLFYPSNSQNSTVGSINTIPLPPNLSPKADIEMHSPHVKKIKSHQPIGRQISSPPVLSPYYDNNDTPNINNFLMNNQKNNFISTMQSKCDSWESEGGNDNSNSPDYKHEKQIINPSKVNSTTAASVQLNNVSHPIPKYSDLQLSSLLPISSLVSSNALNAQALISTSSFGSLPEINKCIQENFKTFQDHTNKDCKPIDSLFSEPSNIYANFQQPNALKEMPHSEPGGSTGVADNPIEMPTDYTITLPSSVNMNISYLVNTINSPTNLITQVKSQSTEPSSPKEQESLGSKNSQHNIKHVVDGDPENRSKDEPKKITKTSTRKTNVSSRGSESKQWECEDCKKSFTTKYFLKKHKRLHTGETPYSCEECGKTFTFQQSYHKHVFYHSDDKPHICPHCNRAFKEMSTLHNHVRIHTGEKPFVCNTCGKSFRQRVSYLVHQRIHTGILPYRCDVCNRSFRYKVSLRSHKCEGKNSVEANSGAPRQQELAECSPGSSTTNSINESPIFSPSLQARKKEPPMEQFHQPLAQESVSPQSNMCFQAISDPSINVNSSPSINQVQNPSSAISLSTGLQNNSYKYAETKENELENLNSYIKPSDVQFHSNPATSPRINPELNKRSINSSTETIITNAKMLPKSDVCKEYMTHEDHTADLLTENLDSSQKFDHGTFPNLNINDQFSPINLDEDLDNDTFLKSLFS